MERQKILYVSTFGTLTNNTHKQGGHATKDMSKRYSCLEITFLQHICQCSYAGSDLRISMNVSKALGSVLIFSWIADKRIFASLNFVLFPERMILFISFVIKSLE